MPLELVAIAPRQISLRQYQDREPGGDEVLVRTTVSGIKHGTELNLYRGVAPFSQKVWDPELRLFRPPCEGEQVTPFFPKTLGSWAAGVVVRTGPQARRFKPGDRVHGEWKHRQTALMKESALYPIPDGVSDETVIFTDPARFALASIHDAGIKLGDRVAIFGLGAIGLLALQMARLDGAATIFAVDVVPGRLELAKKLGADIVLNSSECDVAVAIKEASGKAGVDVAVEMSGVYGALQQAIRCVQREGLVVTASYYGDLAGRVDLATEWHHNRITLLSSMPVWGCTHRRQPLWDLARLERAALTLLEGQRLEVRALIGATIPFEQAAEAYRMIDEGPRDKVKVLLSYER